MSLIRTVSLKERHIALRADGGDVSVSLIRTVSLKVLLSPVACVLTASFSVLDSDRELEGCTRRPPARCTRRFSVLDSDRELEGSNEWYTPARYIEAARQVMGSIDTDPASNPTANKTIRAATYYTIETNGLDKPWHGNVWLNPPYGREGGESNQDVWSARLIEQYQAGITKQAVLLVNAVTDRRWFQPLWNYPICFTNHRISFYDPQGEYGQPTHGNALVYLGGHIERFASVFSQFGVIAVRWNTT